MGTIPVHETDAAHIRDAGREPPELKRSDGTLLERRFVDVSELRINENEKKVAGYAAKFNERSEPIWGMFREVVAPGAFAKTIKTADVRLLINHDGLPLARTKSNTLMLGEDETGLWFEANVDMADPDVQRIIPKMQRGDLDQMSFGFYVVRDRWDHTEGDERVRTLLEVDLFDISVVTFPAYPQTTVGLRSAKEVYDSYIASLRAQDDAIEIERQRALEAHRERQIKIWRYML